ncbi:SLC13 family permease [Rhodopila sp.]|jgi:di/tricarboxylate transporter|uniref:SLC13 family permease n=1 Tax=Rhodopila sp. TaxID=2480087 RepID=UPI002D19D6CE|nr:SLC13 family permease [Rhodopila sp.]HVZ07088.1 SLC13 family permease [Rhodopila sp.]
MSDVTITFAIVAAIVVLFIWDRFPVILVAIGTSLALYFTGVTTLDESLRGFGDPAVLFIAALFVVSAGLEVTGVTAWAGQTLIARAGGSRTRLLLMMMSLVAVLTALISVNGAVAALLPVVVVAAVRLKRPPSQLLMPLVFASHAGSMLALMGTPVNLLVAEAADYHGMAPFRVFSFALAGLPLIIGTMAIVVLFGERLLPMRSGRSLPSDLSQHARTLIEQYRLEDGLFQLRIRASSPYVGASIHAVNLREYAGLAFVSVLSGDGTGPVRRQTLAEGDLIVVRGDADDAGALATAMHLSFQPPDTPADMAESLFNRDSGLAEVIVPPRSELIGQAVFPGMTTPSGDLLVLAVQRRGEDPGPGETVLAQGDTLLLMGTWDALDRHLDDPDVLVVDSPEVVRRQAIPMGRGAATAIAIMVGMVVLLATNLVPSVLAGLLAAFAMVAFNVVSVDQAYRSINWTTVILIGAMIPLSTAMTNSGAANLLADGLVSLVGDRSPYALLAGLFVLTAVLGQLISNTATALIIIPIGLAAAETLHVSGRPVLMSLTVAAAAAFLTPVATPVNLMVMAPAGYKFGDYWKLGLPMMILFFLVAVFWVPLFWHF